jgi:competence protein ComEA
VVARRHTRPEWEGVMEDMIARGCKGTSEELTVLVDYLNQNLGKINVNEATAKDLEKALKISEADAKAIVAWREAHGNFKNFEEVRKVPGLDQARIKDKRGWMSFDE